MFKRKNSVAIIIGLLLLVVLFACGRKGTLNPLSKPVLEITSYAGADSVNTNEEIFQQRIYWSAHNDDSGIAGFAFRVREYDPNDETKYLETPGWEAIDAEEGWVYHYKPGVDVDGQTPSLDSPEAVGIRQIWTARTSARINFPANIVYNEDGSETVNPQPSVFEVKCITERGEESDIASKIFYAKATKPVANSINIAQDPSNIILFGRGGIFEFAIDDPDDELPGIDALAKEYQFGFLKGTYNDSLGTYEIADDDYGMVELDDGVPVFDDTWIEQNWFTTKNEADISTFRIPRKNDPNWDFEFSSNFIGEPDVFSAANANDATFLFFRVIDLSNTSSDIEVRKFYSYDGFSPAPIIYLKDTFILGSNHYQPEYEVGWGEVIPFQQTASGVNYSKRFWMNKEGRIEVIGSNDIRFYFHWGWQGEYKQDDPLDRLENKVKSFGSLKDYNSEIIAFDLKLNGEPLYYPQIPAQGNNLVDGWLRVYRGDSIFQKMTFTQATIIASGKDLYGTHKLEVRAIDLQNVPSEEPYVLDFEIVPLIEEQDKKGVLVVLDDLNLTSNTIAKTLYEDIFEQLGVTGEDFELIDYEYDLTNSSWHSSSDKISPADLQSYKLVVYSQEVTWASDRSFHKEYVPMYLYLQNGGNLVTVGGRNIYRSYVLSENFEIDVFPTIFGLGSLSDIASVGNGFANKPFFISAHNANNFGPNSLQVQLEDNPFQQINAGGLGGISYFNVDDSKVLYRYGCKEPDPDGVPPIFYPTQEEYETYNGVPAALKHELTNGSKCYLFGFPLLYMDIDGVKSVYQEIWNDLD